MRTQYGAQKPDTSCIFIVPPRLASPFACWLPGLTRALWYKLQHIHFFQTIVDPFPSPSRGKLVFLATRHALFLMRRASPGLPLNRHDLGITINIKLVTLVLVSICFTPPRMHSYSDLFGDFILHRTSNDFSQCKRSVSECTILYLLSQGLSTNVNTALTIPFITTLVLLIPSPPNFENRLPISPLT